MPCICTLICASRLRTHPTPRHPTPFKTVPSLTGARLFSSYSMYMPGRASVVHIRFWAIGTVSAFPSSNEPSPTQPTHLARTPSIDFRAFNHSMQSYFWVPASAVWRPAYIATRGNPSAVCSIGLSGGSRAGCRSQTGGSGGGRARGPPAAVWRGLPHQAAGLQELRPHTVPHQADGGGPAPPATCRHRCRRCALQMRSRHYLEKHCSVVASSAQA